MIPQNFAELAEAVPIVVYRGFQKQNFAELAEAVPIVVNLGFQKQNFAELAEAVPIVSSQALEGKPSMPKVCLFGRNSLPI